jgi:hypothetical protein
MIYPEDQLQPFEALMNKKNVAPVPTNNWKRAT